MISSTLFSTQQFSTSTKNYRYSKRDCPSFSFYPPKYYREAKSTLLPYSTTWCYSLHMNKKKSESYLKNSSLKPTNEPKDITEQQGEKLEDTIRIKIWKALVLSSEDYISLKQLGSMIGERRISEIRSHLNHVEKQAKTLQNKSKEWKQRRNLNETTRKVKISKEFRGKNNKELYIKLIY